MRPATRSRYAQRTWIGPSVDGVAGPTGSTWRCRLAPGGAERLRGRWRAATARDTLTRRPPRRETLDRRSDSGSTSRVDATKPAALHDDDGWIDFGPAGGSYYYSRTAMAAGGTLTLGGDGARVTGDGLVRPPVGRLHRGRRRRLGLVRGQPRDGTDLMLSLVRDADGSLPARLRDARRRGRARRRHLARDAFEVQVTDRWTSPATGADYPAGWRVHVPGEDLAIDLRPTVADQELDTRASTGVVYWEGSQVVSATRDGRPLGGEGYVELTGYAPANGAPGK